jgi:hypothetical protein
MSLTVSRKRRPWWCCHHAAEGEDDRVDGEVAARAVADFVVGDRIEVLVDQLGWVVLLGKTGGAGVLASYGDDCKVVFGAD